MDVDESVDHLSRMGLLDGVEDLYKKNENRRFYKQ